MKRIKNLLFTLIIVLNYSNTFSQNYLFENSNINYIFYNVQSIKSDFDVEYDEIIKTKNESETSISENYIGITLLKSIIENELQAYKISESINKKWENGFVIFPYFEEDTSVKKKDLISYLEERNRVALGEQKRSLYEGKISNEDVVNIFGENCKVFKHSFYFFHPKLNKIVSYTDGLEIEFKKYQDDREITNSIYKGESLYIPLKTPSLDDYEKETLFLSKEINDIFHFNENSMFIKGIYVEFLKNFIIEPTLKGEQYIYQNISDAKESRNKKSKTFLDSIFNRVYIDTVDIYDNTDNYEMFFIRSESVKFIDINKFKFVERIFNIHNGKTLISIVDYVLPLEEVINDDGSLRGNRKLFTIKY